MLPLPGPSSIAATIGLVLLLGLGIATQSATVASFAGAGFVLLAAAYAGTFPLARRARTARLELAWWLAHRPRGPGAVLAPGIPIEVRCFIRHRGAHALRLSRLAPVLPPGLALREALEGDVVSDRNGQVELSLVLEAHAAGRYVAQGIAARVHGPFGLFTMPLYFPHPLAIKVLPAAARRLALPAPRAVEATGARTGRALPRRRGGGTELRELRELVPGDPFKSIAWKTSARLAKLVVREVEQEIEQLHFIVLDVSPSMRGGPLGQRKLDAALDAAASIAVACARDSTRFAAATFDRRIVGQLAPGEGRPHLLRTFDLLLSASDAVDDDLTGVDDEAVCAYVARYLRHQMGLDFQRTSTSDTFPKELIRQVRTLVGDDLGGVRAKDPAGALLRRFCQLHGLTLPYRTSVPPAEKTTALIDALSLVQRNRASPGEITVITDGDGIETHGELLRRASALRARGYTTRFLFVESREAEGHDTSVLGRTLVELYREAEARRLDSQRVALSREGVATSILRTVETPARASRANEEEAA